MKRTTMTAAIAPKTLTQRGVPAGEASVLGGSTTAFTIHDVSTKVVAYISGDAPALERDD